MASIKDNTLTSVKEGSIVNFKAIAQTPLKSLRVNFTPIQQGEGDPSPENIRAISGWTGLRAGINNGNFLNLLAPQAQASPTASGNTEKRTFIPGSCVIGMSNGNYYRANYANYLSNISITKDSLSWTSGGATGYGIAYVLEGLKAGDTVIFNCKSRQNSQVYLTYYDKQGGLISWIHLISSNNPVARTIPDNVKTTLLVFTATEANSSISIVEPQLFYGSTIPSSTYEPYNGTTIPVSWDSLGTVYGGYIDIISGEVWQTWEVASARWGDIKIGSPSTTTGYYEGKIRFTNKIVVLHSSSVYGNFTFSNVISKVIWNGSNTTPEHYYGGNENEKGVCYIYCNYDDNTIIQIAAKLAEPVLIGTIDPITIKSLIGTNNIYSDADSVSVEYYNLESLNLYKQRFKANQPYLQTASGSVASFQTALKAPLKECKVYFEPVQASETPSPDNILPISGWNELKVYHDEQRMSCTLLVGTTNSLGVTWIVSSDGSIFAYGTPTSWSTCSVCDIDVSGTEILYAKVVGSLNNVTVSAPILYDANWNVISASYNDGVLNSGLDLNNYSGVKKVRIRIKRNLNDIPMIGTCRVIINNGALPIIPTESITLPSTYYGGWVDLTSGEGIQTFGYTNNLGAYTFVQDDNIRPGTFRFYSTKANLQGIKFKGKLYCSKYKGVEKGDRTQLEYNEISITNSQNVPILRIRDENFIGKTPEEVQSLVNNVQLAYELQTPLTFTLTPEQLKTLKGINNIWSNTNGNIQTKYWTYSSL